MNDASLERKFNKKSPMRARYDALASSFGAAGGFIRKWILLAALAAGIGTLRSKQAAGFHRARPSTTLDKALFSCAAIIREYGGPVKCICDKEWADLFRVQGVVAEEIRKDFLPHLKSEI